MTCDLCNKRIRWYRKRMRFLNGVCLCLNCVDAIVVKHLYVAPVKFLCPKCINEDKPCVACDVEQQFQRAIAKKKGEADGVL